MDGLFNLKDPNYENEQWRNSLLAAVNECDRQLSLEILDRESQRHQLLVNLLLVKLVDAAVGGSRAEVLKTLSESISKNEILVNQLQTGKTEQEMKEAVAKSKTKEIDDLGGAWEQVFGKRGDPKTESAIQQTTNILMSMITEAEKEKKAQGKKRA